MKNRAYLIRFEYTNKDAETTIGATKVHAPNVRAAFDTFRATKLEDTGAQAIVGVIVENRNTRAMRSFRIPRFAIPARPMAIAGWER